MLVKSFKIFLVAQIILTTLAATDEENTEETGLNANLQKLNAALDEKNGNGNGGEIVQSNASNEENVQLNDEEPYGKVQELKNQHIPTSHKKGRGRKKYRKKPQSSWKIEYAVGKKDEPGFDLTPEEMKKFKIWKDGIIPYYIDVVSFSDKVLRDKIRNFLQMVNSATSINFVELPGPPCNDNERWVLFMNRRGLLGCADHSVKNFTNQGVQQVVLGYDCIATRGELAEAVMSIVGVPAQHNAPDRDKYIKVNMENIMADKKIHFEKLNDNEWLFHDLAYDFDSVTHYDIHKHSANGRATIEIKKKSEDFIPTTIFSATDLQKIKMIYNFIARNKKMEETVCEKLFKISSKFKSGISMNKRIKPRKKPSRYSGIEDKNEPIEEQNEGDKSKEEICNQDDDEAVTDDGEKRDKDDDNETKEDFKHNHENNKDEIIDAETLIQKKNSLKNALKGSGKAFKILKERERKKQIVDILHVLSDYGSYEDQRQA